MSLERAMSICPLTLFLFVSSCLLVVAAANKQERQGHQTSMLKSKEVKRLLFGLKLYSIGSLKFRTENLQALLSCYDFTLWEKIIKFKNKLPDNCRQVFTVIVDEGKLIVLESNSGILDGADVVAQTMASVISVRRCSWLQSCGLPTEVQQTIQNLPFKGPSLFSDKMDNKLHSYKRFQGDIKISWNLYSCDKEETVPSSSAIQTPRLSSPISRSTEEKGREL